MLDSTDFKALWNRIRHKTTYRVRFDNASLGRILVDSGRLRDLRRNPQACIQLAAEAINRCKRLAVVHGVKCQRLGDDCYYAQELFEQKELQAYLESCVKDEKEKSPHEYVVCDSDTERAFAEQLENNDSIKLHAKLPGWFTVQTPLGGYNPDWAVLVETEEGQELYFVVETKGGLFADDLRDKERAKIACGRAHFHALRAGEQPAEYVVARTLEDVLVRQQAGE